MIEKSKKIKDLNEIDFSAYGKVDTEKLSFISDDDQVVKNNLAKILEEKDLLISDLAKLTGVSRQNINAVLHNKMKPGVDFALKLAYVLNMNVEEIFELTNCAWVTPFKPKYDTTIFLNVLTGKVITIKEKREIVEKTGHEYYHTTEGIKITKKAFDEGLRNHLKKYRKKRQEVIFSEQKDLTLNQAKSIAADELTQEYKKTYQPIYLKIGISIDPIVLK